MGLDFHLLQIAFCGQHFQRVTGPVDLILQGTDQKSGGFLADIGREPVKDRFVEKRHMTPHNALRQIGLIKTAPHTLQGLIAFYAIRTPPVYSAGKRL